MKKIVLIAGMAAVGLVVVFFLYQDRVARQTQLAGDSAAVRALVQRYCEADLNGAMLGTENYKKSGLDEIIVAEEGHISPGWDTVTLIKGFKILGVTMGAHQGAVQVQYEVMGELADEVRLDQRTEDYDFRLVKKDGHWKLIEPYDLNPHISIETAIKHMQALYEEEREQQPQAPEVIRKLRELQSSTGG